MNNPLVSVLMPAYNAGPYISEAIQSIIDQIYIYISNIFWLMINLVNEITKNEKYTLHLTKRY